MATEDTGAVLEHHVQSLLAGDVEAVMEDYADGALLISNIGIIASGRDEIRKVFESPPDLSGFEVTFQHVDGDIAYVTWRSTLFGFATDTFLVHNGRIEVQTVAFVPVA